MKLLLAVLLLCSSPLAAQLQVYTVQGTVERAVSGILAMGTTPTGEPLDVVVRIKNPAGSSARWILSNRTSSSTK